MKRASIALLAVVAFAVVGLWFWPRLSGHGQTPPQAPERRDTRAETSATSANASQALRDTAIPDVQMVSPESRSPAREQSIHDQLRQGDYWSLLSEHWRKAKNGAADSQLIVHSVMSFCVNYRKRFEGKHLAEVQAGFSSHDDPDLFILNARVWERCRHIYDSWEQFDGWREMREAAAYNGQPLAMVWKGGTLISDPETFDEGIRWLESALASGDPSAVAMMAGFYTLAHAGSTRPDREEQAAWILAACRLGLDCSVPAESCGEYFTACGIHEHMRDVIIRELGDGGFYTASQRAERIYEAVASGDVESLDLATNIRQQKRGGGFSEANQ